MSCFFLFLIHRMHVASMNIESLMHFAIKSTSGFKNNFISCFRLQFRTMSHSFRSGSRNACIPFNYRIKNGILREFSHITFLFERKTLNPFTHGRRWSEKLRGFKWRATAVASGTACMETARRALCNRQFMIVSLIPICRSRCSCTEFISC